jgi:plasmid stabilization system protein ParE
MKLPIVFRPEARAEFDAAADWYEQRRPGLGIDFIERVQSCLNLIQDMPSASPVVYQDFRQSIVHRFPYSIVYRIEADRILVLAVFHGRRDPVAWKSRT